MSTKQFATFRVGPQLYGVDILRVREVLKQVACSPVPGSHAAIEGLMNLRGQVVTVIDLGRRLDGQVLREDPEDPPDGHRTTCVIIKTDEELDRQGLLEQVGDRVGPDPVGLLVDDMGEVLTVNEDELGEPPAELQGEKSNVVESVVMLSDGLMTELALERVLEL